MLSLFQILYLFVLIYFTLLYKDIFWILIFFYASVSQIFALILFIKLFNESRFKI